MANEIIKAKTLAQESDALTKARALTIQSNDDYAAADAFSMGLLALEKAIKADFKPATDAAYAAHKAITAQEAGHLDKVTEARALIRPKLMAWEEHQDNLAADETARLNALAQKEAEDRAVNEAAEAEKNGDTQTAQAIMEAPVQAAPVVLDPVIPKRQTRIPEAWTYKVTNPAALPREWMCADDKKLSALARSTKGAISVAGVTFYDKNKNGCH